MEMNKQRQTWMYRLGVRVHETQKQNCSNGSDQKHYKHRQVETDCDKETPTLNCRSEPSQIGEIIDTYMNKCKQIEGEREHGHTHRESNSRTSTQHKTQYSLEQKSSEAKITTLADRKQRPNSTDIPIESSKSVCNGTWKQTGRKEDPNMQKRSREQSHHRHKHRHLHQRHEPTQASTQESGQNTTERQTEILLTIHHSNRITHMERGRHTGTLQSTTTDGYKHM